MTLRIVGGKPLRGRVQVPIDLEVAQCSLLMAALADGVSELPALPPGCDGDRLIQVLRSLGVSFQVGERLAVDGAGLHGLRAPSGALDCGSSWIGMSLIAGLLGAQRFGTRITVHPSLADRSVEQLAGPLRARGAQIGARSDADGRLVPPLAVAPLVEGELLRALDCNFAEAESAAKSGVLISALYASGPTTLAEPIVSADHLERLYVGLGLPLRRIGSVVAFDPGAWDGSVPVQRSAILPGSATLASCLAVVAQAVPGSAIALANTGTNPSRTGVLDILRGWGADIAIEPSGDASLREPIGEVTLRSRPVRGGVLGGEELVRARGELAALALLGATSHRGVQLFELGALAPANAPLWRDLASVLSAFRLEVSLGADRLAIAARSGLEATRFDARDDAALALAAVTLAMASPGESVLEHAAEALARTYPGYVDAARSLGAEIYDA